MPWMQLPSDDGAPFFEDLLRGEVALADLIVFGDSAIVRIGSS